MPVILKDEFKNTTGREGKESGEGRCAAGKLVKDKERAFTWAPIAILRSRSVTRPASPTHMLLQVLKQGKAAPSPLTLPQD